MVSALCMDSDRRRLLKEQTVDRGAVEGVEDVGEVKLSRLWVIRSAHRTHRRRKVQPGRQTS